MVYVFVKWAWFMYSLGGRGLCFYRSAWFMYSLGGCGLYIL